MTKKTAIIRFKKVSSAELSYKSSREIDNTTGKRIKILGDTHPNA